MPAAVAVPLIVGGLGAAGEIYSASKQAKSAKDAAAQEIAGADKALAVQKEIYQQQQQNLAPYQQLGAASLGNLSRLASMPSVTRNASGFGYSARPQQMSLGSMGGSSSGPQVGATRTFPNGRTGTWDGQGWVA